MDEADEPKKAELARASWFTGFPWIASGYAHTTGPLAAWAPWVGVYGIGAVAAFTAALVKPRPDQRWLLVTSASHMPRSVGVFRQAGWDVVPWPVNYRTGRGFHVLSPSPPPRKRATVSRP